MSETLPTTTPRSRTRLAENVAAARIELTTDELATLEPIADQVAGNRSADLSFVSAGRE
ncbi:hypothetical protein AB0M22_10340 [Nocardia sp. NPDC051756]|uniref:hypothetical protein n=1 Tax=Nocardia sp. NPDC051756 TaxID=3154751 RepID=UPI003449A8D7